MYKENTKLKMLRAVLIGTLVGILLCSLLMVLLSYILLKSGQIPTNAVFVILQIISALSSFLGSYIAVRIYKSTGLVVGILTSLAMFAIVFLTGLSVSIEPVSVLSLTKLVSMLCAGAIGGILSVNKRKNVNRYK